MTTIKFANEAYTEYGYNASLIDFAQYEHIKLPKQINDEIPTLNQYGFMKVDLDEYSELFVARSAEVEYSMDIGCAYGMLVKYALEKGNKVIALDKSIQHLIVLGLSVSDELKKNLFLRGGVFPKEFDYKNRNISSIMASRIMHFLTGEEFLLGLKKIHGSLSEDGKFYFTSVTPYHYAIRDGFLEEYNRRKLRGEKWPGVIENQWEINPLHKEYVEPYLHVFDQPELEQIVENNGFKIEQISLFDYPNDVDSEGKGHIGFIATKK